MRKMILISLIFPFFLNAQSPESIQAFDKSTPGSLGKPIRLPEPGFIIDYIADYNVKQRIYVIAGDSIYREIFRAYRFTKDSILQYAPEKDSWYHQWMLKHLSDSLPKIDFSKQELVMYSACGQCLAFCEHESGQGSCHRNACNFMYKWFLRDKQYISPGLTLQRRNFYDAFYRHGPDSSASLLKFSPIRYTDFDKYFEVGKKSSYLYTISSDSLYHNIFSFDFFHNSASMPVIDFKRQVLQVRIACHQCLISCKSENSEWENRPCHRNSCWYNYTWWLVNKRSY